MSPLRAPPPGLPRAVFPKPLPASLGQAAPRDAEVGEFVCCDDPVHGREFFARNLLHDVAPGTRPVVGRVCQPLATLDRATPAAAPRPPAGPPRPCS